MSPRSSDPKNNLLLVPGAYYQQIVTEHLDSTPNKPHRHGTVVRLTDAALDREFKLLRAIIANSTLGDNAKYEHALYLLDRLITEPVVIWNSGQLGREPMFRYAVCFIQDLKDREAGRSTFLVYPDEVSKVGYLARQTQLIVWTKDAKRRRR